MDCHLHPGVPSVARCRLCDQPICERCRGSDDRCPGCRFAPTARVARPASAPSAPSETRLFVALGYPFWPLAALALIVAGSSAYVRRNALQAIAFHFSVYLLWLTSVVITHVPVLGFGAIPLAIGLEPAAIVASVFFGLKVWRGEDVRIPLITPWLESYERSGRPSAR